MSRISGASQLEAIRAINGVFHTSKSDMVRLGRRIGTGAEGEVYEIQDRDDLVAKVYHEPPQAEKAEKLVVLSSLGNERLFNLSAWPVSTLRDAPDGEVAGFVMKKISEAEEVHTLHSPRSRLQKFPEASWAFLIYVAANIARAIAAIHEHGLIIGDVNPKNILVTRKATVYLLDVDSFQVSFDGRTYRCEGGFPEYTPPELQGIAFREIDRAQEHDCFGLAVVIFQLLFMGRHPYSGRYLGAGEMPLERAIKEFRFAYGADAEARKMRQPPGALALDCIPPQLAELFRRAFLSTNRPGPREWVEQLDALAKALKKCGMHSGHYYYRELSDCPWCGIEKQARVRLFNFLLPGDDSRRGNFRLDEIWKEIVSVEAPDSLLNRRDEIVKAPKPSAEVAAHAESMRAHFIMALIFSISAGLVIPLLLTPPYAVFLLILAARAACSLGKTGHTATLQILFQNRQPLSDDPLFEKVQTQWRQSKEAEHLLREQFDRETGSERWKAKQDDLRNQKETYENLAQIRQTRLQQLEAEARTNQLDEFLDQFKINDANLKGIGPNLKTVLISYGVETAADLIEDVKHIPSIGDAHAKVLINWRRGLEKEFDFDPSRGVSTEARIRTERELDALRVRLESDLIGGAHYLRLLKQEIEISREKLQPTLKNARQELAQAEKDLEVARKRNSAGLIIVAMIIAFIFGQATYAPSRSPVATSGGANIPGENAGKQPPAHPQAGAGADFAANKDRLQTALTFYYEGERLLQEERFADAAEAYQKVINIDPKFNAAYEGLGYALFRLDRYEESAAASNAAIKLYPAFKPYYNLGLAHFATKNWPEAILAFQSGIELRDPSSWKDEYTQAYYYLGLSLAEAGQLHKAIQELEAEPGFLEDVPINRFKLATFYLCAGWKEAAKDQHRLLKNSDQALARELNKLIKKHSIKT